MRYRGGKKVAELEEDQVWRDRVAEHGGSKYQVSRKSNRNYI